VTQRGGTRQEDQRTDVEMEGEVAPYHRAGMREHKRNQHQRQGIGLRERRLLTYNEPDSLAMARFACSSMSLLLCLKTWK
jgi:hypothetical protein